MSGASIRGSLTGSNGLPISYNLHLPEGDGPFPVVVIVHGFKGFKDWGFFPHLCDLLAERGLAACRLNTSHNGVGLGDDEQDFTRLEVFSKNRTSYEVQDILTILDAVRQDDLVSGAPLAADRIGLLGHSRGGAAVLLAAAHDPSVAAVCTWASVSTTTFSDEARNAFVDNGRWEFKNGRTGQTMWLEADAWLDVHPMPSSLDLMSRVRDIRAPILLIHGTNDTSVPVQAAYDLSRFSDGVAELALIEGADHVMNACHPYAGPTAAFEEAVSKTTGHFSRHLHP